MEETKEINQEVNENLENQINDEEGAVGGTLTPNGGGSLEANGDQNESGTNAQEETQEKLLTQSQVNELVGKARREGRDSAMKDLLARYGVNNDEELNEVFGKGQAYVDLDYDYQSQANEYRNLKAENALLKSQIDETRYSDVKFILGGQGLEVNIENIEALLPTHPEWRKKTNSVENEENTGVDNKVVTPEMLDEMQKQEKIDFVRKNENTQPVAKLKQLGNEPSPNSEESFDEKKEARSFYGL